MAANSYDFGVNLKINADTKLAVQQLESLKTQLSSVQAMKFNFSGVNALTSEINKASSAALVLQQNLQAALNPATGNLNFSKFNASILGAGQTVDGLAESLLSAGSQGTRAFNSLTESVIRSEIPLLRTNKAVAGLWDNLKKTAGWQLSSSMIHGFIGGVQQAVGYAQALDKSLTNIRIVTGQSTEQMAQFAKEANAAARRLSTTTTDYTNASLIYYQQGLSAAEVKKRADVTLKMANVSGDTAEKVANQMTAIWNNFDNGTKSMEHYADVMTALGAATASSTNEIAKGIQKFASISDTVGLSYEYAASALATITATTRESADTVGNSLKTLFSRIQGLQLGDTLDDGTTLNKYSTALAKVGISIKDASGALKDMDTILDDMGAKWHTLAEDQKMALAQTVGGVRQYTQIMTLMENWDFFKSNLGIAQGSAGTLQKQMDIFEDSWQGAQKRMKASWENLWDTLIDSDGFKKILNVGSTIVDGISKSLQGLGGMGGVFSGGALGFIGSGLGTIFKNQIATAADNAIFNVKSLFPSSRIAAENQRSELISSLSGLVRSEYANPYMGAKEREVMANNIETSASEHLRFSQAMKHMSPLAQETYSQLDRQAILIRDQQQAAARQIDEGHAAIARNSLGKNDFTGVYTSKISDKNMGQLTDFARALFGGQDISTIYDVATQFGERSADALSEIEKIQSSIVTGYKYQTPDEVRRGVLKDEYDISSLVGKNETIKTDGGKEQNIGIAYSGQAFKVLAKAYGLTEQEQAQIADAQRGAKGAINTGDKRLDTIAGKIQEDLRYVSKTVESSSSMDKTQQGTVVGDALRGRVSQIQQNVVNDLSKVKGAQKENIEGMITGAQGVRQGQQAETDAERMARENKERREALLRQQQSAGTIITNAGLGISSTATALTSAKGMMESFRNGNVLGGLTGLGSTIMNLSMGNRGIRDAVFGLTSKQATALQAETALGNTQKAFEKYSQSNAASALKLQQARAQLEMQRNQPGANRFTTGLRSTMLSAQEQYNRLQGNIAGAGLNQVNQSLESLNNSNPNALARGLNKVSSGMNYLAQNAGAVATAVQVATIAYSVAKEKLTYIADTNKREAQQAASSATQLQAAYQMSKNNSIAFSSSVEEYNKALDQLTNSNLTGAAKQQAIFDQNTLASDLISKYDIAEEDVSRIGDTIQIKDSALRKKQEELISQASVAKYAVEQAKLDAKEKQNEYDQESLERKMGMDETGAFGFAAGAAGLAAGLGAFALLASGPVGWAVAGAAIAAGAAGIAAGVGEHQMKSRDQSIIDDILEESAIRGGTSWLDNLKKDDIVNGNKISEKELKQIQENREEIDKLYKNEQNARLQGERQKETIARDILSTNEETEDFKYANKLIDGLVKQQETWYDEDKLINYKKKKDSEVIADAKAIEAELGLAGKNVTWTNDKKNERLTYSYMENGQEQTGSLEYTALAETTAAEAGKKEADKYVGQMLETYNNLEKAYGETAAAGMLSLISGGDFDSATRGEMKAAQDLIKNLKVSYYDQEYSLSELDDWALNNLTENEYAKIADLMGITVGEDETALEALSNLAGAQNKSLGEYIQTFTNAAEMGSPIENLMMQYAGGTKLVEELDENGEVKKDENGNIIYKEEKVSGKYEDWFTSDMGQKIYDSMDQATMQEFYKDLAMIDKTKGPEQARAYLNSLSGMLEGVSEEKIGSIMQALTTVDWSDWNGLDNQVIDVLESFDIHLDSTNEHLKNFVNIARMTANSIPNLEASFSSLAQAASTLSNLEIGKSIDDATLQNLKDQGINLDKQTFSTIGGENIVIGGTEQSYQQIRGEIADTYGRYNDVREGVQRGFSYYSPEERDRRLTAISNMGEQEFLDSFDIINSEGDMRNADAYRAISGLLTGSEYMAFNNDRARANVLDYQLGNYREVNGKIMVSDGNGGWVEADATQQVKYNELKEERQAVGERLSAVYQTVTGAAEAALDPAEMQKLAEQYVSTFSSFEDARSDTTVQKMIGEGDLSEADALMYYASKYPELTEYVNAYNEALANNNFELANSIKKQTELNVAMYDTLAAYEAATGKKTDIAGLTATISHLKEKEDIQEAYSYTDENGNIVWDEQGLIKKAEETMIAAVGEQAIDKYGRSWQSDINAMMTNPDETQDGGQALAYMGKAVQQYLGLMDQDILGLTSQNPEENPLYKLIEDGIVTLEGIISKDVDQMRLLRVELMKQTTAGRSLTAKLDGKSSNGEYNSDTKTAMSNFKKAATEDEESLEELSDENAALMEQIGQEGGFENFEEYQAAVVHESGGRYKANDTGTATWQTTHNGKQVTATAETKWNADTGTWQIGSSTTENGITYTEWTDAPEGATINNLTNADLDTTTAPTPSGGHSGGGGGGGPTKVQVKSAQEAMTRYKTIDAKSTIAEMQKANALTQKDLLYGEAKIAQLQKINGLLVKQQRLTADRIEEERQYLAEDKKHLQEVLDRYNKDKKDADGNVKEGEELLEFKFNSEGLITNYKQTIGVMAEELAALYRDGELTAEEGKKAEELQKKIQDLNTVIQDYEDSLNQLQTSIDTYEQTLYEMFANQAEELAYKVTYKLEMENDDLSYVKFYSTALKDSMGRISDYIELTGYQVNELYDQIDVYNQGVMDLMDNAANNPMYMWATKGMEGTLTAEDITNLRTYRDGLSSVYSSLTALRKDIEEKVLKVFDEWHDKVNKNIDAISRYTDMLSQFKDIINIVGKEALGLSDAFMKTFEQQSIDQSKDNIEAAKKQYESLAEIYAEAQMNLEAARASGNEDSIKHWEDVVDKTRSEMEGAQDAMLTTLQHTLNMVAEQFTNAVTTAMDNFNESIYSYNGLDGLIADYERINEQQDLMVADYEKIYNLNKLNRQLEKTLDDTKLIAGKQKLLEFQQKINDINKSNVELSKYELEYLQAEYDLRLAEIELENARNSKDTVRLSRDSEGNWSYIYTQNESAVDEAQQKYEDALFKMQQLSQDYTKEMSASMMEITQAMRDEIAELSIQDFATPEEYYQAIQEIENRYSEQLAHREAELNKSIANSAELYNQDWQNYSDATGYKLSSAEDWTDRFSETTLGTLTGSGSYMSDYSTMIAESTNQLTGELVNAATTYFTNANSALETYGTSLQGFAGTVTSTTSQITASSKQATVDVTNMATDMVDAFSKVADEVRSWQINFGDEISDLLEDIGAKIKEINEIIKQANEMGKQNYSSTDLIGEKEAVKLLGQETFNNADLFGTWNYDEETGVTRGTYTDAKGEVKENVERNLVEFTGQLVEMIDELTGKYYEAETGSPEREAYGQELKKLFQDYWKFKNIINRIYDLTDISMPEPKLDEDEVEGLASGGYTGEWGSEGKLAFLHEKELVLNADDTANFLQALQISRQLVEMIEMNARQSSLGLGEMHASTIQDTAQTIEQQVSITAEFPNAVDHSEIEEAFDNLINMASQYAYRN